MLNYAAVIILTVNCRRCTSVRWWPLAAGNHQAECSLKENSPSLTADNVVGTYFPDKVRIHTNSVGGFSTDDLTDCFFSRIIFTIQKLLPFPWVLPLMLSQSRKLMFVIFGIFILDSHGHFSNINQRRHIFIHWNFVSSVHPNKHQQQTKEKNSSNH